MTTQLQATERSARKEHRCVWCSGVICLGTRYLDYTYVNEGEFDRARAHLECAAEVARLIAAGTLSFEEDGYPEGLLAEGYLDDEDFSEGWVAFYNREKAPSVERAAFLGCTPSEGSGAVSETRHRRSQSV